MNPPQTKLVHDNIKLAYHIAAKSFDRYRGPGAGNHDVREEMQSAALLGLVQAAAKFDPSRGVKHTTYFWRVIQNECFSAMQKLVRAGFNGRKETGVETPSVMQISDTFADSLLWPDRESDDDSQVEQVMEAMKTLPKKWRLIVEGRFLHGKTCVELGKEHGLSLQRISQIVHDACRNLKRELAQTVLFGGPK